MTNPNDGSSVIPWTPDVELATLVANKTRAASDRFTRELTDGERAIVGRLGARGGGAYRAELTRNAESRLQEYSAEFGRLLVETVALGNGGTLPVGAARWIRDYFNTRVDSLANSL